MLGDIGTWLTANAQILGITLAVATLIAAIVPPSVAALRYVSLRTREIQLERFKVYHQLVRELVQPDSPGLPTYQDRQIAIIFELRHFPEYYELTLRMLEGLRPGWDRPELSRIVKEMGLTIDHIASHSRFQPAPYDRTAAPPVT